jgi:hypothetical protein
VYCFDERYDGLLAVNEAGVGVFDDRWNSAGSDGRAARDALVALGRAVDPVPILFFKPRPTPSLSLLSDVEQNTESRASGVVAPLDLDRHPLPDGTRSDGFRRPAMTGVVLEVVA